MKKGINKKALILPCEEIPLISSRRKNLKIKFLPLFILTLLAVNLVMVSAADTAFKDTAFYKLISDYLVPARMGMEGIGIGWFGGLIIGIVSLLILFFVALDIISLIPIFNARTSKIIAVGVGIIMIVTKVNVTVAGWVFTIGAAAFGFMGTFAVGATIFFAIMILIALLFGGTWVIEKLNDIKARRENIEKQFKARKAGGDAAALVVAGQEFEKGAGI